MGISLTLCCKVYFVAGRHGMGEHSSLARLFSNGGGFV